MNHARITLFVSGRIFKDLHRSNNMVKQNNSRSKVSILLPVFIMFAIIFASQGSYNSNYGGFGALSFQPTMPMFSGGSNLFSGGLSYSSNPIQPTFMNYQPASLGSVSFSGSYHNMPVYPTYSSATPFFASGQVYYRQIGGEPIYSTPTTALFSVNYRYSNFMNSFDP